MRLVWPTSPRIPCVLVEPTTSWVTFLCTHSSQAEPQTCWFQLGGFTWFHPGPPCKCTASWAARLLTPQGHPWNWARLQREGSLCHIARTFLKRCHWAAKPAYRTLRRQDKCLQVSYPTKRIKDPSPSSSRRVPEQRRDTWRWAQMHLLEKDVFTLRTLKAKKRLLPPRHNSDRRQSLKGQCKKTKTSLWPEITTRLFWVWRQNAKALEHRFWMTLLCNYIINIYGHYVRYAVCFVNLFYPSLMSLVFIYFCANMQILYYMQKQLEWK